MNKDAYEKKYEAQLDQWKADINKLKARLREADADARIELHELIEKLNHKHERASNKLQELKKAGEETWKDLIDTSEEAWTDLKNSVDTASKKMMQTV